MLDTAGNEIVRHGASGFLGEMNLLSGQTVFLTAVVIEPMRYIAVERDVLRKLLFDDGSLADLLLPAFVRRRELLQQRHGIGIEIVGPRDVGRDAAARRVRPPRAAARTSGARPSADAEAAALIDGWDESGSRSCGCPAGFELERPTNGELSRALGIGLELGAARGGRPGRDRRRAGRARRRRLRRLGGPRHARRREHGARRPGRARRGGSRTTSASRPGSAALELTSRAITQARKFGARTATPYRATGARARRRPPRLSSSRTATRSPHAPSCSRPAPNTGACRSTTSRASRGSASSTPPARRRRSSAAPQRVGVVGGGNSAGTGRDLAGPRRRAGHPAAPARRPLRDDVALPDRRSRALRRRGPRPQRDRRAARRRRRARGGDADRRRRGCRSRSSSASSGPARAPNGSATRSPATRRASSSPATEAGRRGLLETSVPRVYAAGDVRSGSTKRCATAVGEGATVVRFVHEHLAAETVPSRLVRRRPRSRRCRARRASAARDRCRWRQPERRGRALRRRP